MITTLHIENFAIIDRVTIDFGPGFLVFSGETGAGKSILMTALNLLLGERAYIEYIRSGEDSATVEGIFEIPENSSILPFLEERGIDLLEERKILIKRKIFRSERGNRCYINHQPCSLSLLSEMGKWLVDIHGQHEHQLLLNPERHIDVLDAFGNLNELKEQFTYLYEEYEQKYKKHNSLVLQKQANEKEADLLRFQIQEIDQAHLSQEEEENIASRKKVLQNAEKLSQESTRAYQELYKAEGAIHSQIGKIASGLRSLISIDNFFSPLVDSLENASYLIEEVASQCSKYSQGIEFDPHLLDELEERSSDLQKLKRKYGSTIKDILEQRAKMEELWQSMQKTEDEIDKLRQEIKKSAKKVLTMAETLSKERQKTASIIQAHINRELVDLNMPQARFHVNQQRKKIEDTESTTTSLSSESSEISNLPSFPYRLTNKGIDTIEFLFSANQGEEPKALSRIASGGEISRIMLALKSCLMAADEIPVMVFDEIDVGIGGDISRIVGKKLKALAAEKQILCITHSPQIASLGDQHYVVKKIVDHDRTKTVVERLEDSRRVEELARMLKRDVDLKITLKHAQELITNSQSKCL